MGKHRLELLTDFERKFAAENHNLVYDFLHRHGYSLEIYYDIAIFGYLKAVQIYNRREDLRNKYAFPFINQQYMRAEVGNHFRKGKARKRRPPETAVSLDTGCIEKNHLYKCAGIMGGRSP